MHCCLQEACTSNPACKAFVYDAKSCYILKTTATTEAHVVYSTYVKVEGTGNAAQAPAPAAATLPSISPTPSPTSPANEGGSQVMQGTTEEAAYEQYKKEYPLHVAVAGNTIATAKELIESGEHDVNEEDDEGLTPLQVAMTCDPLNQEWACSPRLNKEMAEYLISKGAKVNLMSPQSAGPDTNGTSMTLLHTAANRGLTDLVRLFIRGGADVNAVYSSGRKSFTPIVSAASCDNGLGAGDESLNSTVAALLAAGANPLPFGANNPTTATMATNLADEKLDKVCSVKVGACKEEEVKQLVDKWRSSSHSGSCPETWFEI